MIVILSERSESKDLGGGSCLRETPPAQILLLGRFSPLAQNDMWESRCSAAVSAAILAWNNRTNAGQRPALHSLLSWLSEWRL